MTKKISKEVRQRIHDLHSQGTSVKDILSILKLENVTISEKTVYRILRRTMKTMRITRHLLVLMKLTSMSHLQRSKDKKK